MENKYFLLFANIPTIMFLIFTGYCLYFGHNGFAIFSFILSALCATVYENKNKE